MHLHLSQLYYWRNKIEQKNYMHFGAFLCPVMRLRFKVLLRKFSAFFSSCRGNSVPPLQLRNISISTFGFDFPHFGLSLPLQTVIFGYKSMRVANSVCTRCFFFFVPVKGWSVTARLHRQALHHHRRPCCRSCRLSGTTCATPSRWPVLTYSLSECAGKTTWPWTRCSKVCQSVDN